MKELNESAFDGSIYRFADRTLALFYATWCPFCRRFMPVFRKFSTNSHVETALVDISDVRSELWDSFHIEAIPTVILFNNGTVEKRLDAIIGSGIEPEDFHRWIRENIAEVDR